MTSPPTPLPPAFVQPLPRQISSRLPQLIRHLSVRRRQESFDFSPYRYDLICFAPMLIFHLLTLLSLLLHLLGTLLVFDKMLLICILPFLRCFPFLCHCHSWFLASFHEAFYSCLLNPAECLLVFDADGGVPTRLGVSLLESNLISAAVLDSSS